MTQPENSNTTFNIWKIFIILSVIFTATSIFLWFGSFAPRGAQSDLRLANGQKTLLWNNFIYVQKNPIELADNDPYQHFKSSEGVCPEQIRDSRDYPFTKQKDIIESSLKTTQALKKDEATILSNDIKAPLANFRNSINEYLVYQKSTIDIYEKIDDSAYKIQSTIKTVCTQKTISSSDLESLKSQIDQAKTIYGINASWIKNVTIWSADLEKKNTEERETEPNLDSLFTGKVYLDIFQTNLSSLESYTQDSAKLINTVTDALDKMQQEELSLSKNSKNDVKLVFIAKPNDYLT